MINSNSEYQIKPLKKKNTVRVALNSITTDITAKDLVNYYIREGNIDHNGTRFIGSISGSKEAMKNIASQIKQSISSKSLVKEFRKRGVISA